MCSSDLFQEVAVPGADQTARMHDTVTLDGTGSSDVDGDTLTYAWTLAMTPAKSRAVLTGADSAHPTFVADKKGPYAFMLTVSDGHVTSAPASVSIVVKTGK